jgi:hypothetical protein
MEIDWTMKSSNLWTRALAIAALALLVAGGAYAQLQTGNLYGTVADEQGAALPGVTVTLTGGGAPQVQVTNAQGQFRFLSLAPGSYGLKAELEGFSTVDYPNITINVGRNTNVEVTMSGAVEDVITVTAESPLLDERRISTGATVAQTELEKIPTARDPWAILQTTPGVLTDRINVGGNESGQQSTYISPGTNDDNSTWSVDGVVITDMGAIGSSPSYYNFDSFEEMQVTTGGSDVSLATGGVAMNMVTKRGTNEWRFSARYFLTDDSWQSSLDFSEGDLGGGQVAFGQGNRIVDVKDYGIEGGGPIVKDKAWIWGSYGVNDIDLLTIADVADATELESYAAKLNAQLTSNNSLTFFYHYGDKIKTGRNAGPTRPQPTTWNQDGPTDIWKLEDTQIFNSNFYLTGLASHVGGGFQLVPQGGGVGTGNPADNVLLDLSGTWQRSFLLYQTDRPTDSAKIDGNYFFNTGSASHELRFGVGYRDAQVDSFSSWPGQQTIGIEIAPDIYFYQVSTNRNVSDNVEYTQLYVQDTVSIGNLTANLGLRYDIQSPTNNPTTVAAPPAAVNEGILFPNGASFAGGDPGFEWKTITPRLGLTYALGEDRSTLLRLSYSQFADQMGTAVASFTNVNYNYGYGLWYDDGDGLFEPDERTGFFSFAGTVDPNNPGTIRIYNNVDSDFDAPVTDEIVASIEHSLLPEFVVGLSATWRNYHDLVENERQVLENGVVRLHRRDDYVVGYTHRGRLPDGSTFAAPQYTLRPGVSFLDPNTGVAQGFLMENGDREQDYLGVSLTFNKRLANRWLLRGHFTWADWEWSVPDAEREDPTLGPAGGADGDPVILGSGTGSGAKGGIYINSEWSYDISGMYQIAPDRPWGFNLAANINGRQGYPVPYVSRRSLNDGFGAPRSVLVAPEVDTFRHDDILIINARVEKEFTFSDWGMTLSVDGFNLFNESTVLQREIRLPRCDLGFDTTAPPPMDGQPGQTPNSLGTACTAGVANGNTANPSGINRGDFVNEIVSPRVFRIGLRINFR